MGREVRRVAPDWVHPYVFNDAGRRQFQGTISLKPLYENNGRFDKSLAEWEEGKAQWEKGFKEDWENGGWKAREADDNMTWEEWHGSRPDPNDYMPNWTPEQATHYQMYEDTSEGTPISPVFATPEELARWLTDNGASTFADMTASYEQWLRVCKGGWAPSAVIIPGQGLMSGVEADLS